MTEADLLHDLTALTQVLFVDLALAGDNAVVVGLAVAGLPASQRRLSLLVGIGAAALLRIALGTVALRLLQVVGLLLAGGLLLLWVCWRMFRELRRSRSRTRTKAGGSSGPAKSLRQAILQIALADLSMSLDNVLAVAGAAEGNTWVLVVGLGLSVALMGLAANLVASLLVRHRWLAWVGLLVVLHVALRLIWDGGHDVLDYVT